MWISRIELINFKSYQNQVFKFPAPSQGKNIILIGGLNGYGKTTILEALYLGLYGKDSIIYLARAGIKGEVGYPVFLARALHGIALETGQKNMSVTVVINVDEHKGFQVTRKWFFSARGDYQDEELLIYDTEDGVCTRTHQPEELEQILDQFFIPAHLAPFFFFDGEEVKRLADRNRVEQVKIGMEGLLGVVLLRNLEKRLREYQTNRNQSVPKVDEKNYYRLQESLAQHEQKLEECQQRKKTINEELSILKEKREDLIGRLIALSGGGVSTACANDILAELRRKEDDLNKCQEDLEKLLGSRLSFHLISQEIRDGYVSQLKKEEVLIEWNAQKRNLEINKEKFISKFFAEDAEAFNPDLTNEQYTTLLNRLETSWKSLFNSLPDDYAGEIVHDYIHEAKRRQLIDMVESLSIGAQDILGLLEKQDNLQKEISKLRYQLTKIEGIDHDGTLTTINTEIEAINNKIDQKQIELGSIENQISELKTTINNERSVFEREHERFLRANPVKSDVARAERVIQLIKELIPSLYKLKINHLSDAVTNVFQQLSHKKEVARVEFDETGKSVLISSDGNEITFDMSAGENQLFATALLAGFAEVSGVKAPLVVDTPLARLDSNHRKNILNFWIRDRSRQVILLSQDKEIDADARDELKDHIAQSFLLQHEQIRNGVGKTVAILNAYFGE